MRNLTFTLSIRFSKITLVLWVMRLLQIKWLKNQEWQKTINFSKLSLREESHITEKFHQLAFTSNIQFLSKIHSLCYEVVTNKMARKIEHSLKTIYFWNYLTVINYTSFESPIDFLSHANCDFWNNSPFFLLSSITNKMVRKASMT